MKPNVDNNYFYIKIITDTFIVLTGGSSPFSERRRTAFKRKEDTTPPSTSPIPLNTSEISISSIDINLNEENEELYQMGVDIEELYEPISLCLVSKYPLFDGLQVNPLYTNRLT